MTSYRRGDVVLVDLKTSDNSHIQGGTRPCIIVQNNVGNFHSTTTIIVPLTSHMKRLEMPTHVIVPRKDHDSVALCEQVQVIDNSRVVRYLGTLPPHVMKYVDKGLKNAFFYKEVRNVY